MIKLKYISMFLYEWNDLNESINVIKIKSVMIFFKYKVYVVLKVVVKI